ncbi:MAG: hypothetical protein EPN47_18500 [Acidobacteria bacterium]|nr:MAG: hypothetical protein EPN47_18500 [Acidobacteriota bacterium]
MTEEIKTRQTAAQAKGVFERGRQATAITGGASRNNGTESSRPKFNKFIYENLVCHVEGQVEAWNRKAVREANPEAAHALRLKAEGLGYALQLLDAFKPEFDELVAIAERSKCKGCGAELENRPYQPAIDSDLCDSCYEIAYYDVTLAAERSVA